jgi:hypothetical protein
LWSEVISFKAVAKLTLEAVSFSIFQSFKHVYIRNV